MRYLILLVPFLLAACADASAVAPQSGNAAYALEIAKGRATASAIETDAAWSANAALTADARTVVASNRNATLAAQAQQNAMLYAQATSTAQAQYSSATSTALFNIARAAETMQAGQAQANATATSRASDATATSEAHKWQTTATAERRTLEAEIARVQATATAQVLEAQIIQAKTDAERVRSWSEFFDSVFKFIVAVGSVALFIMLIMYLAKYLDAISMARRLVNTREGTVMLTIVDGRPTAQLIRQVPNLLDVPEQDYFELPAETDVTQNAREIAVRTLSGKTFTVTDVEDENTQGQKLAMRLLRASIDHYRKRGFDPHAVTRITTWRDLEWSADTWSRAVDLLRPHLNVRTGRGGGVYCGAAYPNLVALYVAVGERRAALSISEAVTAA